MHFRRGMELFGMLGQVSPADCIQAWEDRYAQDD